MKPLNDDLSDVGAKELLTPEDKVMAHSGITLVVINSVCGCAEGMVRPAIRRIMADESIKKPGSVVTVFVGQDLDATTRL
ncbi:BrxA/BrxB family bacilliredoxin [Chitinophaga dinghuensis]|uniref:BrxA/BrxB family bacilliredoxin n=1 Tax=Chitinophaga dinghuensis TaxID=1539050 RepID=UPI000DBA7FF1